MNNRFVPTTINPVHPNFAKWSMWTKDIAEDIVLRYWGQGGMEHPHLEPYMMESFCAVCEAISDDCDHIWTKAWKAAGNKR